MGVVGVVGYCLLSAWLINHLDAEIPNQLARTFVRNASGTWFFLDHSVRYLRMLELSDFPFADQAHARMIEHFNTLSGNRILSFSRPERTNTLCNRLDHKNAKMMTFSLVNIFFGVACGNSGECSSIQLQVSGFSSYFLRFLCDFVQFSNGFSRYFGNLVRFSFPRTSYQ